MHQVVKRLVIKKTSHLYPHDFCSLYAPAALFLNPVVLQEGKWGTTDDIRDWLHGDGVRLKVDGLFRRLPPLED